MLILVVDMQRNFLCWCCN